MSLDQLIQDRPGALAGVTVRPWHPNVGARISGYRYAGGAVPEAIRRLVTETLFERGVIVFEAGTVTEHNLTAFVYDFLGEPVDYHGNKLGKDAAPSSHIDSIRDDILRNHVWHVDGGYTHFPPDYTGLLAVQLPDIGGDTIFSHAIHAYESLHPRFRDYLDTLSAVLYSDGTGHLIDRILDPEKLAIARRKNPSHEKPVVKVHPVTGRRQIAVNESYTHFIAGVSRTTSQNILNILFDAVKSPENTARLTWSEGEFALWDNRVVQHRVIKDYASNARRRLLRVTTRDPAHG